MRHSLKAFIAVALLSGAAVPFAAPLHAADAAPVDARVDRLEKEMRAVQRKVFPAGTPVEPEIVAQQPVAASALPSSTPVTDLIARVSALETQLATITGQVEQNSYKIKQLESKYDQLKAGLAAAPAADAPAAVATLAAPAKPAATTAAARPATTAAATTASDKRKGAVAAIERPETGNAANDSYVYGYRLWEAKFYPEAQAQLKTTVEKYGGTSVGSRAANLLGRAYLDDGKPALASVELFENYQKRPDGDRAPHSLAYLGDALIQLKKPADACKVYKELEESYSSALNAELRSMMEKGRVRAKCSA